MIRKFIATFVIIFFAATTTAFAAEFGEGTRVTGVGIGPAKYKNQIGLYKICAYRAARMDAFAKIAEELVKIAEESASPDELKSSEYTVMTSMSGVIKGALQIDDAKFSDDVCEVTMELIEIKPGSAIRATGFGIGPTNLDKQDSFYRTYARQTARMDALRNLSEIISGIKIESKIPGELVLDTYELKSTVIHDQKAFKQIKEFARQVGEAKFSADGVCEVTMELIIPADWKE